MKPKLALLIWWLVLFLATPLSLKAFYDPGLQRWINRDPIGENGGLNLDGFVFNAPVTSIDPWGLSDGCGDPELDEWSDSPTVGGGLPRAIDKTRGLGLGIDAAQATAENLGTVAIEAATLPLGGPGKSALAKNAPKAKRILPAFKQFCKKMFNRTPKLTKEQQKSITSIEKQIAKHQQKLDDFKANPTVRPGMENMPEDVVRQQQKARIEKLGKEIESFERTIEKIKKGEL